MTDFEFDLDADAIAELAHDADVADLMQFAGDAIAVNAADLAPKQTGEGAASIHAEVEEDEDSVYADVSWDRDHFYLYFAEVGTEHETARPFLRPALDSTEI